MKFVYINFRAIHCNYDTYILLQWIPLIEVYGALKLHKYTKQIYILLYIAVKIRT